MHISTNKILKAAIIVAICYCLFWLVFLMVWKISNRDIKNVEVYGQVFNGSKEPLPNASFQIINHYYEGGDYDGFAGIEKHEIHADDNGNYYIHFEKSAFIQVKSNEILISDKYIQKKKNLINVTIK